MIIIPDFIVHCKLDTNLFWYVLSNFEETVGFCQHKSQNRRIHV